MVCDWVYIEVLHSIFDQSVLTHEIEYSFLHSHEGLNTTAQGSQRRFCQHSPWRHGYYYQRHLRTKIHKSQNFSASYFTPHSMIGLKCPDVTLHPWITRFVLDSITIVWDPISATNGRLAGILKINCVPCIDWLFLSLEVALKERVDYSNWVCTTERAGTGLCNVKGYGNAHSIIDVINSCLNPCWHVESNLRSEHTVP